MSALVAKAAAMFTSWNVNIGLEKVEHQVVIAPQESVKDRGRLVITWDMVHICDRI